jgi:hypothetical protein
VTGGVSILHQEARNQKTLSKKILFALVYFGIPIGLLPFIVFRLLMAE